ncbi:MAG: DUF808 family protein [Gemmatimonadaceae bacterium]|nr:DUF808 family protein [Gemmatimonadaceae bacterium]
MAASSLLALIDDIATLLDDVATLSGAAAKKTAGVMGDDLALNAEQVAGVTTDRELPVVWAVARGSLLNKLILVPAALVISAFLPVAIKPLLMIGGLFLCYEGFEKVWHKLMHKPDEKAPERAARLQAVVDPKVDVVALEKDKIKGAVRTDFILSAEIVVIALGTMASETIPRQIAALSVVAIGVTVLVYGLVAGIVKLDDLGLRLRRRGTTDASGDDSFKRSLGKWILRAAPVMMKGLSILGTAAMFMVGGSIIAHGIPMIEHFATDVAVKAAAQSGILGTIAKTALDAVVGIAAGGIAMLVVTLVKKVFGSRAAAATAALLIVPMLSAGAQTVVDTALFGGMRYRMVGPFRGGRSTAVTGVAGQPHLFYMGTTGGGVWKSDDAGTHWTSITDGWFDNGNIGAIDVADSDPNVIYVGTGSASIRGNVSVGTGAWKSIDAGRTWTFIGLRESGAIGKLVVHPTNPDIVYVAALGHPFGRNPERGVFRTTDGGATWSHVLKLNDSTGAVSIVMSPDNPRELWAGMWRAERKPWTLISGGPAGGLYHSTDGGDSWQKVGGGLPAGMVGKVQVTVSPADPSRLWTLIEAEPGGGLYRSDDRGVSWSLVNSDAQVRGRPFYYGHVRADPKNRDLVYVLNVAALRSIDGGRSFSTVPVPHGDVHDIWINPVTPEVFAISDDGGTVVTLNGGRTFSSMYNQPTAELYDVQVDNQVPYRIYGSQQDNTAISVLQRRLHNTLRPQQEWGYGAGCETGPVAVHPDHPDTVWGGCYGGAINRYDVTTDTRISVKGWPEATALAPSEMTNRWQWVSPIVVSPQSPRTLYHASQYLYRSRDGGDSWTRISPDLTTNDRRYQGWPGGPITPDNTGVEVFTTIFSVVPSPHDSSTIWVGTDDGRVQLTRDGGTSWTSITPTGMPVRGTVNRIEVSPHAPGRAFISVQRYREDDFTPYVFRTDDFGRTWKRIADGTNGIPSRHFVRVVREDTERRGLLYAGTEFGAYVSFTDGAQWQPLQLNLPVTPVTDIKVHRGDLVLSTQGRSFWVLDDLTPLRELAADGSMTTARLYTPRPAARGVVGEPLREVDLTLPDDLPEGALIRFALGRDVTAVELDILDRNGTVVRGFRSDSAAARAQGTARLRVRPGMQQLVWDLRGPAPMALGPTGQLQAGPGGQGVKMPPGSYVVRLTASGVTRSAPLTIIGNPRAPQITQADYDAQLAVSAAVRDTISAITTALATIRALPADGRTKLAALEGELVAPAKAGQPVAPARLLAHYNALYNALTGNGGYGAGSAEGRPLAGQVARKTDLDAQWTVVRVKLDAAMKATMQ